MYRRFGSRGHRHREGAAADRARGRGRLGGDPRHPGGRRHRRSQLNATCIACRRRGGRASPRASTARQARTTIVGTHLLLAVGPPAQHRRPRPRRARASRATRAATSRSTTSCAPTCPAVWAMGDCNGRGAFTHTSYNDFEIVAAQPARQRPRRVQRPHHRLRPLHRSAARPRRHDRSRGAHDAGRKALVGKRPMTRVARAVEKGETQGFMKVVVDAETKRDPRRRDPRRRRRRGHPRHPRRHVRQGALHRAAARHAHPPDGLRAAADDIAANSVR